MKVIITTKKSCQILNDNEKLRISRNKSKPKLALFSNHPYRILISVGSGSGKTNVLLNLIKHQGPPGNKFYLYIKDPLESKYQLLIHGTEKVAIIHKQF